MLNGAGLDAVVIATAVKHALSDGEGEPAGRQTYLYREADGQFRGGMRRNWLTIAEKKGLVLMVGHTFLYSPAVRKIKEIVEWGDIGEHPLHLRAAVEPRVVSKGHQRGLGSGPA